jgi:hypothetical protein
MSAADNKLERRARERAYMKRFAPKSISGLLRVGSYYARRARRAGRRALNLDLRERAVHALRARR